MTQVSNHTPKYWSTMLWESGLKWTIHVLSFTKDNCQREENNILRMYNTLIIIDSFDHDLISFTEITTLISKNTYHSYRDRQYG